MEKGRQILAAGVKSPHETQVLVAIHHLSSLVAVVAKFAL